MTKLLPVNFRKSSTLIILAKDKMRIDKQVDFKALLFNRHKKATFMPNSTVFPGGVCETIDETPLWRKHFEKLGVRNSQVKVLTDVKGNTSNIFKDDSPNVLERQLSLRITAIRETFEELGILFCRNRTSLDSKHSKGYGNFEENFDRKYWQTLVHKDANKFLTLCEELDVVPDLWSLYEWSNWFTPSTFKKRFDTAFFMVALEKTPDVLPEEHEVENFTWKTPKDCLLSHFNKEIMLPPPQIYELSRLLNFTELENIKHFAQQRSSEGSIVFLPVQYELLNGQVAILPGDDMYPEDPNIYNSLIKLNKTVEEFREGVDNIHRIEYFNSHNAAVRQSFTPWCGHIKPIMVDWRIHD